MISFLIVLFSIVVAFGRFLVPGHELSWPGTYEAFAHIWVGILFCFAFIGSLEQKINAMICLALITGLEIAMFYLK